MSFLKRILRKPKIAPGRYSYRGEDKFAGMSLQLRIEKSGQGVMVINANTVLHLNHSATTFAYFFMQGLQREELVKKIRGMYRVNADKAKADYEKLVYTIRHWRKQKKLTRCLFLKSKRKNHSVTSIPRLCAWI